MQRRPPVMLALLALTTARAACPAPVAASALVDHVGQAEAAFAQMDPARFADAADAVRAGVPCLDAVVTPRAAGAVHLSLALAAFLDRDEARTIAAFQALEATNPEHDLRAWLPERHPLLIERRYARRFDEDPAREVSVPGGMTLWVDGTPAEVLVPSRPAVLQLGEGGAVRTSAIWEPGAPLPGELSFVEPGLSPRLRRRLALGSATVAAAGATTGLLLWSADLRATYLDPSTPYADLARIDRGVSATSIAGIAAGALAAGLGTTLVILW